MKPILSDKDKEHLEKRIAEAEKITMSQIVLATVRRSDNYREIPWKAFAIGASVAGLPAIALSLFNPAWPQNGAVIISVIAVLAAGALAALLTIVLHPFARLFLSAGSAEAEVNQFAESLFLAKELFATKRRTGILLLISIFERKVIILPDKGVSDRISPDELKNIIALMKHPLGRHELRQAMEIALDEFITIIKPLSVDSMAGNELSDKIIEEEGL